jgi:hypothetical protein
MNAKQISKIDKVIQLLVAIRSEMEREADSDPIFPESRKAMLKKAICLSCDQPIIPGEKVVRHVHERCRQEQKRFQKEGGKTDAQLVELGLLAPKDVTGRRPLKRLETRVNAAIEATKKKPRGNDNND